MTRYFEAKTDSGYTQIADDELILYLRSKTSIGQYYVGTRKLKYAVNDGTYTERDVLIYSLPIVEDVLYIGSPSSGVAHLFPTHVCYVQKWDGYNPTESLGKHNVLGIANIDKSVADAMTLYTFGQSDAPAANIGLECYNASGKRVFSSARPILKILDMNLFTHCNYGKEGDGAYKDLDVTYIYNGKSIAFNCCYSGFYNLYNEAHFPICVLSNGKVQLATVTKSNYTNAGHSPDNYIMAAIRECIDGANQTAYSIVNVTNY